MQVDREQDDTQWCYRPSQSPLQQDQTFKRPSFLREVNKRKKTVHVSMMPSNKGRDALEKQLSKDQGNLLSFSSILFTRQRNSERNLLALQNEHRGPNKRVYPHDDPVISPELDRFNQRDPNVDLRSKNPSIPIEQEPEQFTRKDLPVYDKTNRLAKKQSSTNEYGNVLDENKRPKPQQHTCSKPCILLSLLIGLLLLGAVIGGTVAILTTLNKKSTTTAALTTTVITPTICSCLCPGESWRFDSGYLARWPFDGTFDDLTNNYNATPYNSPSFVTNGYVNQALLFNASAVQSLSAPYIHLAYTSFTVEVWLKPTFTSNIQDYGILGLCPFPTAYQCLHLTIRKQGSNFYLHLGFFNDDCQGNTALSANQWIHAAFVFDMTTMTQSVYLDGKLDRNCTASSPIIATTGLITIGAIGNLIVWTNTNFYQGYMDHLTITRRAKSACEIWEDATLVSCFLFDATAPYTDLGPNSLRSTSSSTSIISSGLHNEAISFNGTAYFQASSFTALGISNKTFSIVLWLRPRSMLGTIVHVSTSPLGPGWCLPFLAISSNGAVVGQEFSPPTVGVSGPSLPMSSIWSHIVQTWSVMNGLRLYVNGVLVASLASAVSYLASGQSNFVTLADSRNGTFTCFSSVLLNMTPGELNCDIDDFRVYSRELTASDVLRLYQA